MKLHVEDSKSPLGRMILAQAADSLDQEVNIPCEGKVYVEKAFMGYDSELDGCRPHLRLVGSVESVTGDFGDGIGTVMFARPKPVSYRYMFTDDELATLCKKGLFHRDFECPPEFTNNDFELPLMCARHTYMAEIEDGETVPVLVVDLEKQYDIQTSSALSGYDITSYFPDAKELDLEQEVELENENELTANYDMKDQKILDLHDEDELDEDKEQTVIEEIAEEVENIEVDEVLTERVDPSIIETYDEISARLLANMKERNKQNVTMSSDVDVSSEVERKFKLDEGSEKLDLSDDDDEMEM